MYVYGMAGHTVGCSYFTLHSYEYVVIGSDSRCTVVAASLICCVSMQQVIICNFATDIYCNILSIDRN